MTSIPDYLPTLAAGGHTPNSGYACGMEYASILAGEEWSDGPACTHPMLAQMVRSVNDLLPDDQRHLIAPLIPDVIGTADTRRDGHDCKMLSVRLAVWCARQVLDRANNRAAAEAAIDAAEGWCEGRVTQEECRDAANATGGAAYAAAYAAANATDGAAYAAAYADGAVYAAAIAANATSNAGGDLVALLAGLIAEHKRLTGHQTTPVTREQWEHARAVVAGGVA